MYGKDDTQIVVYDMKGGLEKGGSEKYQKKSWEQTTEHLKLCSLIRYNNGATQAVPRIIFLSYMHLIILNHQLSLSLFYN